MRQNGGLVKWGLFVALMLVTGVLRAGDMDFGDAWNWPLPPRYFGALSQDERVRYTKAEDLIRKRQYEAAAVEFEKFMAQFPQSSARGFAALMQGYGYHLAKKRNKAIGLYTEAVDFFAGKRDVAVPALVLNAVAQAQNGNAEAGIRLLEALVAKDDYLEQPMADVALNRLADYYQGREDLKKAEQSRLKVLELYTSAFVRPRDAADEARRKLILQYLDQRRYDSILTVLDMQGDDEAPMSPVQQTVYVCERAGERMDAMDEKSRNAFLDWFLKRRVEFDEAGSSDDFLKRALGFAQRIGRREDWTSLMNRAIDLVAADDGPAFQREAPWVTSRLGEAARAGWAADEQWKRFGSQVTTKATALAPLPQAAFYGSLMDQMRYAMKGGAASELRDVLVARSLGIYVSLMNPEKDAGISRLVDYLRDFGQMPRAHEMAQRIEDPALAQWKEIELFVKEARFAPAAEACEKLEESDTGKYAAMAMETRAGLYKENLARYDDAIKLYSMINEPPRTIWAIVDCQERANRPDEAVGACSEIENFFENDAPAAALRKAQIWDRAKDSKRAIAACRDVLKKYPRHQVSSEAHQMLERYGINTGGGVMELED